MNFTLSSHWSYSSIKKSFGLLALLKELSTNSLINASEVPEKLLGDGIVLEKIKALALATLDSQTLDVVVDKTCKVWIWCAKLSLAFLTFELQLIHSILKDLDRSINIILEHERASEQVVSLECVASNTLTQLVHLAYHLVQIWLHSAFVHLSVTNSTNTAHS